MFLLNLCNYIKNNKQKKFTIQNVSIKLPSQTPSNYSYKNLQYKMFLLNQYLKLSANILKEFTIQNVSIK